MLDKKITKEISNLLTSSDKARKAISAEIDKIDAKYKALAEKEKSKLSKMLKSIEEQMESYKTLLGLGDEVEPEAETEEPEIVEEEEKVVDNLFPENNVEKPANEDKGEDYITQQEIDNRNLHFPEDKIIPAEPESESEKTTDEWPVEDNDEPVQESDQDDNSWPTFPEEWK